ncbi:MAG: hypothetical protein WBZ51_29690, partial [Xanthobacteraceae bacterium]
IYDVWLTDCKKPVVATTAPAEAAPAAEASAAPAPAKPAAPPRRTGQQQLRLFPQGVPPR